MLELTVFVGLTAAYFVTAWQRGSIFSETIAWIEDDMLEHRLGETFGKTGAALGRRLRELLLCPLCLSPYVCGAILFSLWLIGIVGGSLDLFFGVFASASVAVVSHFLMRRFLDAKEN